MRARVTVEGGRQYEFAKAGFVVRFSSVDSLGKVEEKHSAILATQPLLKPGAPLVVGFCTGVVGNFGVVAAVRYSL